MCLKTYAQKLRKEQKAWLVAIINMMRYERLRLYMMNFWLLWLGGGGVRVENNIHLFNFKMPVLTLVF